MWQITEIGLDMEQNKLKHYPQYFYALTVSQKIHPKSKRRQSWPKPAWKIH